MTDNKYWIWLEHLRRSGKINMFGACPLLQEAFNLDKHTARNILADWMNNYDANDYEKEENNGSCEV